MMGTRTRMKRENKLTKRPDTRFLPYVGYVTIAMVSPTVLHPLYSNHFTLYQGQT